MTSQNVAINNKIQFLFLFCDERGFDYYGEGRVKQKWILTISEILWHNLDSILFRPHFLLHPNETIAINFWFLNGNL